MHRLPILPALPPGGGHASLCSALTTASDVLGALRQRGQDVRGPDRASQFYGWIDEKARGDACIECGECLDKCSQGIDIPEWMKVAHEALAPKSA
ncbi:MAG TPA: hypothetical protein PKO09_04385 [Anaerolineae bacterium]|nr:hypothetical protein [Anaerolineae bacterium]